MDSITLSNDLVINTVPCESGSGLRLRTEGLRARKHPELEMVAIPEGQVKDAAGVLGAAAEYVSNQQVVAAGERIALMGPRAAMVVGLEAAEDPTIKQGFFGKLFGKPALLRIVEPDAEMEYPKTLLSTLKLWRAAAALAEEEAEAAKELLQESIAYFPGDPARRDAPGADVALNWENHLAYAMLAELEPAEAGQWLEAAISRADSFELDQLGDHAEELLAESRESLVSTCAQVLDHNLHVFRKMPFAPGVCMLSSPIWRHAAERNGSSVVERTVTMVPESFAAYYYEGEVAQRLEQDEKLCFLVADAIHALAKEPAKLAAIVHPIRQIYEGGEDAQMVEESAPDYRLGAQIASLLLADLGRRLFAGLSSEELQAAYGVSDDEEALAAGNQKMAELEVAEAEAYLATVQATAGMDPDGEGDEDLEEMAP